MYFFNTIILKTRQLLHLAKIFLPFYRKAILWPQLEILIGKNMVKTDVFSFIAKKTPFVYLTSRTYKWSCSISKKMLYFKIVVIA